MKFTIEIAQDCKNWNNIKEINVKLIEYFLNKIIQRYSNFKILKEIELSVLLTSDHKIQKLNKEFRNKDSATNVLSFPDVEIDFSKISEFVPDDPNYLYLGDIAFAFETIQKESIEYNIEFINHFNHLLVHSILHLIGYDHQNDQEAQIMENLEDEILSSNYSLLG